MKKILVKIAVIALIQVGYVSSFGLTGLNAEASASSSASLFNSEKDIITRAEWGANESYMFIETNNTAPDLVESDNDFVSKYDAELKIERKVTHNSQGKEYKWAPEYPEKVTKFMIHHTATTKDLSDPAKAVRNIYYYHAVSRGWGDIGYNYIIDREGRVYEGRYGGEGVVGGHAGPGNIGSIGIALLGNYENEDVPEAMLNSLAKLIAIKSKIHDINPTGKSSFRGINSLNVMGHGEIMSTQCPGGYLKEAIPMVASMAKSMMSDSEPKFIENYDYSDASSIFYVEMNPNTTKEITIRLENTGKSEWDSNTFLTLQNSTQYDNILEFPERSGLRIAKMTESQVLSGKYATFKVKIKSKKKEALSYLEFTPVINGEKKLDEYKILPVKTNPIEMTYQIVSKQLPPSTMEKGGVFTGIIKLKNTSNVVWKKVGKDKVYIKDDKMMVGKIVEKSVAKGAIGTFKLTINAPTQEGTFSKNLGVYSGDGTKLIGGSLDFQTLICKEGYFAQLLSKIDGSELKQGGNYNLSAKIQNVGSLDWSKEKVTIDVAGDSDIEIKDKYLSKTKVSPGADVDVKVSIKISREAMVNTRTLTVTPKIDGVPLTDPIKINFTIIKTLTVAEKIKQAYQEVFAHPQDSGVTKEDLSQAKGGKLRVKIGFAKAPAITSDREFYLYKADEKIKAFKAGEVVTLSKVGIQYRAKIEPTGEFIKDSAKFKLVAQDGAALEIKNFERSGDNKFRGSIEVEFLDAAYAVINELYLEDYLKGLAEEPNDESYEKIKSFTVAARSYAKFYMHYADKFPGKPYDLQDDPATSQKYLGYGYELRAPNVVKAAEETSGEVVTYIGELIKTPYFSSNSGRTKSASEVWSWDAPYLVSVDDPYCKGGAQSGHGVGMSGCGARGMAKAGKTYKEILKYYYTGTEVTKMW